MKTQDTVSESARLDLAKKAFQDFYYQCFWYMKKDLKVGPDDVSEIIRGLRRDGGRRGFELAAQLCR